MRLFRRETFRKRSFRGNSRIFRETRQTLKEKISLRETMPAVLNSLMTNKNSRCAPAQRSHERRMIKFEMEGNRTKCSGLTLRIDIVFFVLIWLYFQIEANTGNSLVTRPNLPDLVVRMLQLASNAHWELLRLTNSHHALQSLLISAGHLSKVSNLLDVWLAFLVSSPCLIKMFTWMKEIEGFKSKSRSLAEFWESKI